jgi:H+-translocating NAD(P) transhydrogenase subunit alpha
MKIGVIRESRPDERRVASTPANVEQFLKLGYEVVVDAGAGASAGFPDAAYEAAGASIGQAASADIVLSISVPADEQLALMSPQTTLISMISPALNPDTLTRLNSHGLTAFSMDAVPRISRAQSLDVLSSMANIAGYRAVIEAANVFGRFFTGQVTAAGKVPPAKVLVVGAGVAGLAAIGVAGSMGAVVFSTDPRPEVADQVKSLGGEYIAVEAADVAVSTTGYAKEMSDDYNARAAAMYAEQCKKVDIIITTALIPGKPAPRLITADMVASMAPGSVIVDMAASNGGNVEGSVAGEKVVTANGVTILGYTDLAGRLPAQASQLYGTNLLNLLKLMTPEKDGVLVLDWDDVVQRAITVVRGGEITWPPPQVAVSAAPVVVAAEPPPPPTPKEPMTMSRRFQIVGLLAALLFLAGAFAPSALLGHLTVFALAIVIGYYVIGHVHHALHTPLMSVTNAISGIIIVGALLQIGHNNLAITILSAAAILLASINIFGGFAVTRRMLSMFSRS